MSLTVNCESPIVLLSGIKKAIKDKEIKTWGIVLIKEVEYFTHTPDQWNEKAFFESSIEVKQLRFRLTWYKESEPDIYTKGVYHGRFIEMICNHFGDKFSSINTVLP